MDEVEAVPPGDLIAYLDLIARYVERAGAAGVPGRCDRPRAQRTVGAGAAQEAALRVYRAVMFAKQNAVDPALAEYEAADRLMQAIVGELQPEDYRLISRITFGLANNLSMRFDPEEPTPEGGEFAMRSLPLYLRAAEAAKQYGRDPVLTTNIYSERAYTAATLGRWRLALRDARTARGGLDPATHPVDYAIMLDGTSYVYSQLAAAMLAEGKPDVADRAYWQAFRLRRRGIAVLRKFGPDEGTMASLYVNLGELLLALPECPDCRIQQARRVLPVCKAGDRNVRGAGAD